MVGRHPFSRMFCVALVAFVASVACARDPLSLPHKRDLHPHTNSLTPPPKEWAFSDDPVPPPTNQPQAPQPNNNTAQPGGTQTSAGPATGSVVSAAVIQPRAHVREFPLMWVLLTGALSIGAMFACGSLIMRQDAESTGDDVPVVSGELEVK